MSSAVVPPGGTVSLYLSLKSPSGSQPAAIEWTFAYSPSDLAGVSVSAGAAATAGGKSLLCAGSPGSYTCLLTGLNANIIRNGVVAVLTATVVSGTTIAVTNALSTSAAGSAIETTAAGGRVSVGAPTAPIVSTGSASGMTGNSATLGGSVNPNGADTHVWFQYSINSSMSGSTSTAQQDIGSGTSLLPFSANIAGLAANTTYYFQAWASNSAGTSQGSTASFILTTFTISGTVTQSGSGLSGVTVTLSGSESGTVVTGASGAYSFALAQGGSYTVTPALNGCTFTPPSQSFSNLSGNQIASFVCQPESGIISPVPGITLAGSLANFAWSAVSGATNYQLTAGTTPGSTDIFSGATAGTSQIVGFIPCTDSVATVYVQLAAEVGGSFQPAAGYSYKCKSGLGDFNGDGHQDLLWQNNSTGEVKVNYFGGAGPQPQGSAVLDNGSTLAGWKVVGAADFDRNGVPDLVLQNTASGQVIVDYYGGAGGTTVIGSAVLNSGAGTAGWSVVAVADMNRDGVPDLIWQDSGTGQVNVNYYGGSGGAAMTGFAVLNSGDGTAGWRVVAAADFDQNGTPDLVWQNQSTGQVNVNYYRGTTMIGVAVLNSGAGTAGWSVVGAADWNDDGIPDLVWQDNSTLQVNVNYYGSGGGATLKGFSCLNCSANFVGWSVRAVAAFGSSGEQSLVWQNASTGAVNVYYYGLGGYVFQDSNVLNNGAGTSGWRVVGAADFDGNGVPDLVWQNTGTGQVNVNYYGGNGGAALTGYAVLNGGAGTAGWRVVAVADMNGDGVPDLIWQNTSTGQVNVNYYGGAGGATLTGYAVLNSGAGTAGWQVVAAADFDGNGVPDLVWQNAATRQVNVNYYGGATGTAMIGSAVLNAGTAGWTVVGASDFDGNGVPDLVWQNDATAQVTVNYYSGAGGATLNGWNWLEASGNPGWTAVVPR